MTDATAPTASPLPAPPASSRARGADDSPGAGLAVLVNANAKRGGRRVAAEIARVLPGASVRLTKSVSEVDAWLRALPRLRGVLAAGGDGTAMALVNALARVTPPGATLPTMGILPLGTGNAWAHALGAPRLHRCLSLLAKSRGPLPTHRADVVEVDGILTHFAGSGWDAMILDDYERQLERSRGPGQRVARTVYGYALAALLRTVPRVVLAGNPIVTVENLGPEVYAVDAAGRPLRLAVPPGGILYEGPSGVASVGTCPEFGYRFRAFPFAERMPGFLSVRVFARGVIGAVRAMPGLWRGAHPLEGMHDWLATHVRMTFSRPVPLQVGGDAHGLRRAVEYRTSPRAVRVVAWRRLG